MMKSAYVVYYYMVRSGQDYGSPKSMTVHAKDIDSAVGMIEVKSVDPTWSVRPILVVGRQDESLDNQG